MKRDSNSIVRKTIIKSGHAQWEVAQMLGYGESAFSRKLRTELTAKEKRDLVGKIKAIRW